MLYFLFKCLFQLSTKIYFKNFAVNGLERIKENVPLVLVANHPAAFLDGIIISIAVKRKLSYLAKAKVFQSKFAKYILPKFNLIPIYRAQDDPGLMYKNEDVFKNLYSALKDQAAILIFPEGISLTDRVLKKIKTGAARISLGAVEFSQADVEVICVGLNYSNPHRFRSDVLINISEPISCIHYLDLYKQDANTAVQVLTDEIRQRLEGQLISIENNEIDDMVANIELIYSFQFLKAKSQNVETMNQFELNKKIAERVDYYYKFDKTRFNGLKQLIENYMIELDKMGMKDPQVNKYFSSSYIILEKIKNLVFFLFGFPVFLFGAIHNFLPYNLPKWLNNWLNNNSSFDGAMYLSFGSFSFLIIYLLEILAFHLIFTNVMLSVIYIFALPLSGIFTYFYWRKLKHLIDRWRLMKLYYSDPARINQLINMRNEIVHEIEKAIEDFKLLNFQ